MVDLILNDHDYRECPRHGMMFIIAHEVLVVERTWDDDRGEFETTDAEPAATVIWFCTACDENVPAHDRSRPWSDYPSVGDRTLTETAIMVDDKLALE